MSNQDFSKISSKLLKAKVTSPSGELIQGYPICAKTKTGQNSYWMILTGTTVETLTTGGMVNLGNIDNKETQPNFLKAKAKSFVTREWVEGYPFYAEAETEEASYWMIKAGCSIEDILSHGLVNIIPDTISYIN
ncbi:hypothetical protein [Niabella hibiscisoli]|uniref:hypothetical protein n=1 Tax=Niabella hibiscisoli TaxID=1825928 RepID=UPI001F0D979D|nr:hypothetical protein [Niabella hibiscisoli]MCH5716686.1 hypothetical protein [Niabella hibiscisoli]